MVNIQQLIDAAKRFAVVRELRWPDGVRCPKCTSGAVSTRGFHTHQAHRWRYECQACGQQFDDLMGRLLIFVVFLIATAARDFTREIALVSGLL